MANLVKLAVVFGLALLLGGCINYDRFKAPPVAADNVTLGALWSPSMRVTLREGRFDVAKNVKLFEDSNALSRHFAETQS